MMTQNSKEEKSWGNVSRRRSLVPISSAAFSPRGGTPPLLEVLPLWVFPAIVYVYVCFSVIVYFSLSLVYNLYWRSL